MARKRPLAPLVPPELLSDEDMQRFRTDPNFRAERREAKRMALAPPAGGVAIRGYRRDWLFDGEVEVPPPVNVDPLLVRAIRDKNALTPPLTDKITAKYDIYPYKKSAQGYGQAQNRRYAARIREEVRDQTVLPNFVQGIERNLIHVHDNLQWNLWLKKTIADWRLAYINTFLRQIETGLELDDDAARHTAGAVADVGYCLRRGEGLALLKHLGQDDTTAKAIEHVGQYAATGHPETLVANMDLVLLAREEQEKRADYWGERYDATYQAFGNSLSNEDLAAQTDLDLLLEQLYSQIDEGVPE
jgi:hypothetical protein